MQHMRYLLIALTALFVSSIKAEEESPADKLEIDDEYKRITWGSSLKLYNKMVKVRLASGDVAYGGGSRQQGVTASTVPDDTNHFWRIKAPLGESSDIGTPVACGSMIRLLHMNSREKYLHSHEHKSPLSAQQEVSAFDGQDSGDHWRLLCDDPDAEYWEREMGFFLQHVDTEKFLHVSANHEFMHPLNGHMEVSCVEDGNEDALWHSREGIYFQETKL